MHRSFDSENILKGLIESGSWRSNSQHFIELQPAQSRNALTTAKEVRDQFCHFFNNSGAVYWRDNMISILIITITITINNDYFVNKN